MVQQMDTMMKVMPLMSVFMCFSMPSGLGIYWITSAVVRTIQQVAVNKQLDKKSIEETDYNSFLELLKEHNSNTLVFVIAEYSKDNDNVEVTIKEVLTKKDLKKRLLQIK